MNIVVFLGDGKADQIVDPIYSVRVTAGAILVAYTWTNGALVFDQVLPVGQYAIVGARFESAGLIAFRFLFQGSTPRPGGIGGSSIQHFELPGQRFGKWGVWGTFDSTTPPTVDFFSGSADASEVGVIDLVKVG